PGPVGIAPPPPITEVRIVPGPQERFFAADAVLQLIRQGFVASASFDRMGRAIEGSSFLPLSLDMPSEPALRGALQIDGAGRMTLLLADHQTTGGYPKIATVIGYDVDRLAQLAPGAAVRFRALTQLEAIAAVRAASAEEEAMLHRIAHRLTLEERLSSANLISGVVNAEGEGS
ncbi:hypothetical protein, partial [Sphingomonas sp. SRS2]|uniref:hypothetical protein n=1 Tax=Sphingomonas sp. SRS2 TaxID=133190 RepID=UPI00061841DD